MGNSVVLLFFFLGGCSHLLSPGAIFFPMSKHYHDIVILFISTCCLSSEDLQGSETRLQRLIFQLFRILSLEKNMAFDRYAQYYMMSIVSRLSLKVHKVKKKHKEASKQWNRRSGKHKLVENNPQQLQQTEPKQWGKHRCKHTREAMKRIARWGELRYNHEEANHRGSWQKTHTTKQEKKERFLYYAKMTFLKFYNNNVCL